ncbi:MAG: type II toxin-antitoxin system ParD family antitoxin [Methylobacter sp.]|nr:MAG: type II toxin-antitoxin system ParD family antitoxin [Methylobacter sp.]PPD24158.1 MAG: type II toxin-antitoxin system ParD family antitoxin [Methylobacter sp.]PPD37528.1 MAG: type II toxin-antitoxin system ParD family antitoxin [Methylomonas sp.]
MATMNISLPEQMHDWVQAQIESGQYASSSDYLRDLIRQDQERKDKIKWLQDAITEGINSGEAQAFDLKTFLHNMKAKHLG